MSTHRTNLKIETWNEHEIRFLEKEPEDWWGIGIDVARALEYARPRKAISSHCPHALSWGIGVQTGLTAEGVPAIQTIETKIIPEIDIYDLIFAAAKQSRSKTVKVRAVEFKTWVYETIKALRQASGLEGFQIFRLLDIQHQKEAMRHLNSGLNKPVRVDFMKANSIANKAISNIFGYAKMVKKGNMTPEMLSKRQPILEDTVNLMTVNEKFSLGLSVSQTIYDKYR